MELDEYLGRYVLEWVKNRQNAGYEIVAVTKGDMDILSHSAESVGERDVLIPIDDLLVSRTIKVLHDRRKPL